MTRILQLDVSRVLSENIHELVEPAERDAMLEVAYLAIAADGKLMEEELEAFVTAMLLLYGPGTSSDQVRRTVDHLIDQFERGEDQVLLTELASHLTRSFARDQAYKLAYAMAMSDFDTDDQEFAFDQRLRRALELDDEQAETLTDQVIDAIRSRD
jgi:tellurite resistance protein